MANAIDINGLSFTPKENPEFFTRAMFGGNLVTSGKIRILMGIKGDELLTKLDLENKILQADGSDCAWTPNQIVKLTEKVAKIKTYKVNLEECISDLERKRTTYMLKAGANSNDALPPELEDAIMTLISIGLSNEIEEMIIGGDKSKNPNEFDGMQTILLGSTEATKIKSPKHTKDNIMEIVEKAYDRVKEEVLQAEETGQLFAFCSYGTRRKLRSALTTVNSNRIAQNFTLDDSDKVNPIIFYLGMELVPVKGIDVDTLIITTGNNSILTTDLLGDLDSMELGQFAKPHDDKVFIKGRMRLGFVIPFEDEAVISSPLVTVEQTAIVPEPLRIVPPNLVFPMQGGKKEFTVVTDEGREIEFSAEGAEGFTVTKVGLTENGVSKFEVTADANDGGINPKTGQVRINIKDSERGGATVMLETSNSNTVIIGE